MAKTKNTKYLFRGTTLNWEGNDANKHLPITSVTTHPIKAVLFALCCRDNNRVVYINTLDRVAHIPQHQNVLAVIEDEIGLGIKPIDYAQTCEGYLQVEDAITILKAMGLNIPQLLDRTLFDMALKDVKKVNGKIVETFYQMAKPYLRKP